jgi:shikimate dehydrogenase
MSISGKAKLAGVIGWPVTHSLSPRLHSYWLAAHAIDGAYVPLPVAKEDFARVIGALRRAGFVGVNVTVPHKEAAFALAHELGASALAAGAVNLLLFRQDGRIEGRNTDAGGLAASLQEVLGKNALTGKSAVLLGAGGAARAAVLALADIGARDIRIVTRDVKRGETLARELSAKVQAVLKTFVWDRWADAAKDASLLVNATSAGMTGAQALNLPLDPLPVNAAVCDLVYNPLETDLLRRAQASGHRTIDGLGMLMYQAVPAFEAFYGEAPKVNPALRAELKKGLRGG